MIDDGDELSPPSGQGDPAFNDGQAPISGRYTSIVYFHGMGTPRRYEELSRVLDTLDRYAEAQNDPQLGRLRGQRVRLESARTGPDEPVAFIEFFRVLLESSGEGDRVGRFRLYESYWSPAAAGGVSPPQVLTWVLSRVGNPLTVLTNCWRAHQRLKRTFLNRLYYDQRRIPVRRFQMLNAVYRSFEGMDWRRLFPAGRFHEFIKALQSEKAETPKHTDDAVALAFDWRDAFVKAQLIVLGVALTVVGVLAALFTLALGAGLRVLALTPVPLDAVPWLVERAALFPLWLAASAALALTLGYRYSRLFLKNFLSDVVFWTTTFEKDVRYQKRRDILRASEAMLRHVLSDPACERVVVVAHSLGTAIAYETLLNLGRRAKAEQRDLQADITSANPVTGQLSKLSHFLTFGSPIDRIDYFFNLTYSRYHRFNKVADDLLGGTGDPPFRIQKKRRLQWINIRDRTDPIATRLFSPRGRIPNRSDIIEIEVGSSHVPNPVRAHGGYFDARLSAKVLFDACILDRPQVQAQEQRSKLSVRFRAEAREASRALAALLAWTFVLGAVAFWTAAPTLALVAQLGFGVLIFLLLALSAAGVWLDRKEPLTLPA